MSKPANKTMIGAFVLVAVVLAVAAVLILGSGKFFKKTAQWVAFFEGSVQGLNVGSPVVFRGVKVGEVTDIIVTIDPTQLSVLIPVVFETDLDKFKEVGPTVITSEEKMHRDLISKGLRAQLQMQSLVTGQLMINLDFHPNTPAKFVGIDKIKTLIDVKPWWEIPTIPTPMQELEKAVSQLDLKELAADIKRAMDGLANLATSPDLHASIGIFKQTLTDTQKLVGNLNSKIGPLADSIEQTLAEARAGIGDARKLVNEQGPPLADSIKKAVESATIALDQANTTLKSIEAIAQEGGQLRFEVSAALEGIEAAARSVRILADFIEQHPDALIRGRATQTGEK
jgi:paraquat-inducible protein B